MRVPRVAGVRTSSTLGRYSSAIRAACANERSCGSARGAISNGRPYRDLKMPGVGILSVTACFQHLIPRSRLGNITKGNRANHSFGILRMRLHARDNSE
jgi:hypothetical protein